jgi:hypothetical protein
VAVSVAVEPGQIAAELTVTTGNGLTVTVTVCVLVQEPVLPVTV